MPTLVAPRVISAAKNDMGEGRKQEPLIPAALIRIMLTCAFYTQVATVTCSCSVAANPCGEVTEKVTSSALSHTAAQEERQLSTSLDAEGSGSVPGIPVNRSWIAGTEKDRLLPETLESHNQPQ